MSTVITIASLKGGVGKTSTTIQLANCLAAAGKKVLVIDMDYNNSVSYYYLNSETENQTNKKNIALALQNPSYDLTDFILPTNKHGIKLIPSSMTLLDMRTLNEKRLSQIMPTAKDYDFVIIDTQPTYDNLVINCYYAADFIITPIMLSQFDYNTAATLHTKMIREIEKADQWFLHINGYNHNYQDAKSGIQKDYLRLFSDSFENFTPKESWFPWTSTMKTIIDRDMYVSKNNSGSEFVLHEQLHSAVCEFAKCFYPSGEAFPDIEYF